MSISPYHTAKYVKRSVIFMTDINDLLQNLNDQLPLSVLLVYISYATIAITVETRKNITSFHGNLGLLIFFSKS